MVWIIKTPINTAFKIAKIEFSFLNSFAARTTANMYAKIYPKLYWKMYDNPPFQTLLECVQSAPLMFGNTLALIYYDKYLVGNKLSLDDKQIEALDYAFSNMSPSVNIIFVCRISRDEYKNLIEKNGGKNVGSISKKTSFILAGENMGPSKLEKAEKLGIPIVS